jgi:HK97 family phage major capsid protein
MPSRVDPGLTGRQLLSVDQYKQQRNETDALLAEMSAWERQRYSLVKVLRHQAEEAVDAGLEKDVSQFIAKRLNREPIGMFVPTTLRGLDTKTNAAGAFTVETDIMDLIELLRNRSRVLKLGARLLTNLDSNLSFPVEVTGSVGTWVGENPGSDVSESDVSFGSRNLSPKMCTATTSFSQKLLAQSSPSIEGFVRRDIANAHAVMLDAAAIAGTGSAGQPLGILNTAGIGNVAIGTNGGVPVYANLVDLETAVANSNADESQMAFLTTPSIRSKLRKVQEFATTGEPAWQQSSISPGVGNVLGYSGMTSKNVPSTLTKGTSVGVCHAILFGAWDQLIIGEWGVLDILVDQFRLKKQGMLEVTSYQMVDVMVRQPSAFAAVTDATLT